MDFEKQLLTLGIKPTVARVTILQTLFNASSPLSFEQINSQMSLNIDKATFYRSMAIFEKDGVVSKIESNDRRWYYELNPTDHAHFICESCNEVTCTSVPLPKDESGNEIKSMVFKGTCSSCRD